MSTKLFVGNIPYSVTEGLLRDKFSQAGQVESVKVPQEAGRSRGFGFIEMSTQEEAQNAISTFNNTELEGRKLIVNIARPRESFSNSGSGRGGFGSNRGGSYR